MSIYFNRDFCCSILIVLLYYILPTTEVIAQQKDSLAEIPLSTNRPSISQGADVVPKNTFQVEIGISYNKDTPDNKELKSHVYPDVLLRFGILKRIELQLSGSIQDSIISSSQGRRKVQGIGPVGIGVVGHILDEKEIIPSVAIISTFKLPVGDENYRPKHVQPLILLAASKGISSNASILMNWGYSWAEGDPTNHFVLCLSQGVSDVLSIYLEAARDKPEDQKAAYIADAGLLWLLKNNLQIDLAAGRQLNDLATDFFITTGLSFRLPR
jgi:hypothetical protein